MKKLLFLNLVSAFFLNAQLLAQTCPTGPLGIGVVFGTQGQVDSFLINYPECNDLDEIIIIGDDIHNLQGFQNITTMSSLKITNTTALTHLQGLDNLKLASQVTIENTTGLVNLAGLENLQAIQAFSIINNQDLTDLSGLENLMFLGGPLMVYGNGALTTLTGLENITLFEGDLRISNNPALASISALSGIIRTEEVVLENNGIESLDGLQNLTTVGGSLHILDNWELTEINSLNHTMTINGILEIRNNPFLPDCAVQAVCDYINYVEDYANFKVSDNTGNCATVFTVEAACLAVGTTDLDPADVQIAPNPTTGLITLTGFEGQVGEIEVVGAAGWRQKKWLGGNVIDLSGLPAGVYFVAIAIDGQLIMKRVVKI